MHLNICLPETPVITQNLPFGGTNCAGTSIAVNSKFFIKNGMPWFPIMGEFHFSRYPASEWEVELLKIKSGGVDIVATYVFWIHHEEVQGEWNFHGQRNLKKFISLCNKHSIPVLLRIGPWAHGECRNGGFPDWLQDQSVFNIRENDPIYLNHVKQLYTQIFRQVKDFLFFHNGCIIGIQLDNEYGPCGIVPGAKERMAHMQTLKDIAVEIGFRVPLYTATGWSGAAVIDNETLPVMGGYSDAPWAPHTDEMPESINFLMSHSLNDTTIGSDHKKDEQGIAFTFDVNKYPFITAELGGGMQVTEHRRVVLFPYDTLALAVSKLGSGAVLLGYYMYHGGTNPVGKKTYLQESKQTGYPNDLPRMSYDFQAPLGETGLPAQSYFDLKPLHLFLHTFGHLVAPTATILPDENCTDPKDTFSIRCCVRHNAKDNCGFVIINNHLRKRTMQQHENVTIHLQNQYLNITLPPFNIKTGDIKILPYNLPMEPSRLISTNAMPLTKIGSCYFFVCDVDPIYHFEGNPAHIVTLTTKQAQCAYQFGDSLYLSDAVLYNNANCIYAQTKQENITVTTYNAKGVAKTKTYCAKKRAPSVIAHELNNNEYELQIDYHGETQDCILTADYIGDKAELYDKGLISDWFTTGLPYQISLARYNFPTMLRLKIYPTAKHKIYFDIECEMGCALKNVTIEPLYTLQINM